MSRNVVVEGFDMEKPLGGVNDTRRDDVFAISNLWRQIGGDSADANMHDPEQLRVIMAGLDYLVLRNNTANMTRLIGAVSIMNCYRGLAKLDSLAVHPEHQRQGHGRTLARCAIEHCVSEGYEQIIATAMPSSRRLLGSLGFETIEKYDSGNRTMMLDL